MPRPKRIHYEGAVYHVTSRGNERRKIVVDDADRWMFIRLLGEMIEENKVVCHAWVLMDNHYHLEKLGQAPTNHFLVVHDGDPFDALRLLRAKYKLSNLGTHCEQRKMYLVYIIVDIIIRNPILKRSKVSTVVGRRFYASRGG
jgi:hypothetical protein